MIGKFKKPFLSCLPVLVFFAAGGLLAAQGQEQDQGTVTYPVNASEIDASVTGDDRALLIDAMSQFPPEQRGKVIVVTDYGYAVSNHPELLENMTVTPDTLTAPYPGTVSPPDDGLTTTGSTGTVGPPGTTASTTGDTTGTTTSSTTGTTTNSTTGTTTGSTTATTTASTTGDTTGTTTSATTGTTGDTTSSTTGTTGDQTTGATTGQTTGSTTGATTGSTTGTTTTGGGTTGGSRTDAIGCDCTSGQDASQVGRFFPDSGPYRRRITTHGQGLMGVTSQVYLPGRTHKAEATPAPTFTQLKQNQVFHQRFMRSAVPGFEYSEAGNPWIYMGGSYYDNQGHRYGEVDLGLQASGTLDCYKVGTSVGGYTFDFEKVWFEMNQTVEFVLTPGNGVLGLLITGKEYVAGDAEGAQTSVLVIAKDSPGHVSWSQTNDNGEFKMCTSLAQAALVDDNAAGGWRMKNADVPDQLSWICGVRWSQIQVKPKNAAWRDIVSDDIADVDNYPAAVVGTGGSTTHATGWLNKPIVVTISSVKDETVSVDLRRGRTQ